MVKIEQIISIYRNYKEGFIDEIEELNKKLNELGINCEVISKMEEDGETLIFKKKEL